jgi:hypothetical protein
MGVLVQSLKHFWIFFFLIPLFLLGLFVSVYQVRDTGAVISYPVIYNQADTVTANEIIEKRRLGSIRREFPDEMLEKTLDELENLARQTENSEVAKKAKKALKLLKDGRFKKP